LSNMLLAIGGGWGIWFVLVLVMVHPHWWFLLFSRTWVLPSYIFFSPFPGCFALATIGKFSSLGAKQVTLDS
jgi:hypothetical protein